MKKFSFNPTQSKPSRLTRSILMVLGLSLAGAALAQRPEMPTLKFADKSRGMIAIKRLADKLPQVAAAHGMTAEKLQTILQQDSTAWIDETGRVLYIDEFPELNATTSSPTTGSITSGSLYPLDQTFALHSKPGSKRVIYLDFNGHTVTTSAWSSSTINAAPFDFDGNAASFSTDELTRIQNIWQRVAQDYAPFDVDVTTQEPTVDLLERANSTDQYYGTRAVITRNDFGACGSCGGVAYIGVFDYTSMTPSYYQPAWVFFDMLGSGNEKYVAEAISHEVGHNLGLNHDGTSTQGYYTGHNGWAPIMGVGYYQPLVQWSKGEYPDANNQEDDFAIMQASGALLKTDDAANTLVNAAALAGSSSNGVFTIAQNGLIASATDQDVYSLVSDGGSLQLSVTPLGDNNNLDVAVDLLNANGTVVASSSPTDALSASLAANIVAGSYYLRVQGSGRGDLTSGYSNYGSAGDYSISGTFTASSALPPVAVATATPTSGYAPLPVNFSSGGSSDSDGSIVDYAWNFGDGTGSSEANPSHTYANIGSYQASLTVTDSQGLKNTANVTINAQQNALLKTVHIDSIVLTSSYVRGSYQCTAQVAVKGYSGNAIGGAKVTGLWSGATRAVTATTASNGIASFAGPKTKTRGTCTFGVNSITATGWTYDASQNLETTDSLSY